MLLLINPNRDDTKHSRAHTGAAPLALDVFQQAHDDDAQSLTVLWCLYHLFLTPSLLFFTLFLPLSPEAPNFCLFLSTLSVSFTLTFDQMYSRVRHTTAPTSEAPTKRFCAPLTYRAVSSNKNHFLFFISLHSIYFILLFFIHIFTSFFKLSYFNSSSVIFCVVKEYFLNK